jgi:hypothetical protein
MGDVSHILLLNRRNSGVEPTLFVAELGEFWPYQQRLPAGMHHQTVTLQEIAMPWTTLKELAGRDPGVRKRDGREKRKEISTVKRFSCSRDLCIEVRDCSGYVSSSFLVPPLTVELFAERYSNFARSLQRTSIFRGGPDG